MWHWLGLALDGLFWDTFPDTMLQVQLLSTQTDLIVGSGLEGKTSWREAASYSVFFHHST